jgi:glycosyltransferase involved in cell wall biosynthesis
MISGRDIIIISSIEWGFIWQGHQEIALRFARAGNRVLYIENTGVRSPGIKDLNRITSRLKRWWKAIRSSGIREVEKNLFVCSPIVLPPFGSRFRRFLNRKFFLSTIKHIEQKLDIQGPLIWTYLPTDTAHELIKILRSEKSKVVYYVVADFEHLVKNLNRLKECEQKVIEASDAVFTICTTLTNRYAYFHSNTHTLPFGVDFNAFQVAENESEVNRRTLHWLTKLEEMKRPIIGYVGGLHRHVDFDLLAKSAKAKPEWSWVFIGPSQANMSELDELPNVHFLGQQPHEDLVHFLQRFDVCIVPYLNNDFTATVVPVKLNEYLAVGKPVVSTNIPVVCEFNNKHNVIQTCENTPESFLAAIEKSLNASDDESTIENRKQVASLSEWQKRLEAMCEVITKD